MFQFLKSAARKSKKSHLFFENKMVCISTNKQFCAAHRLLMMILPAKSWNFIDYEKNNNSLENTHN
jgi:hypothetical protein